MLTRTEWLTIAAAGFGCALTGLLTRIHADAAVRFVVAAGALAILALLVGQATERLAEPLGPGATGFLQSLLGNLPVLFVSIFALRDGLDAVVKASLAGAILANSLLMLGLAFLIGGLRHGTQRFAAAPARMIATLILLGVAGLAVPTLVAMLHTPAESHIAIYSAICAVALLVVFIASIPVVFSVGSSTRSASDSYGAGIRSIWLALVVLAAAGIGAAFVADWFVAALRPAMVELGLSDAFTGLVVVALAGSAVGNVIGIQMAARNRPDYAISLILNSSLQAALALAPLLALLSFVVGREPMTLVLPGLLIAALALAGVLGAFVMYDGESTWLEGLILIGFYAIIAAAFWWG